VGRVVAVPCWSQSRHRQTTVSTNAIASMLITSVTGRQRVTGCSFPERQVTSVRRVASRAGPVGRRERDRGLGSTGDRPGPETKVGANEAEVAGVTGVAPTFTHPRASREGHQNL
jgi:hypothetical protein